MESNQETNAEAPFVDEGVGTNAAGESGSGVADKMAVFREDFGLLIEAGFVAVKQLDETSAARLFNAAQSISPKSVAPKIGLGYIALNKLQVKEAIRVFEGVIEVEPDNMLAQVFLGISYLLVKTKRKKGEQLIADANSRSQDPTIKNLAQISLEWAEKDLRKGSAPFFLQNKAEGKKESEKESDQAAEKQQSEQSKL